MRRFESLERARFIFSLGDDLVSGGRDQP
jgi:hypothetical protein